MKKTYSQLILLPTFEERFEYLKLSGLVGYETFGSDRYFNQAFYRSGEWKKVRRDVIVRDGAHDLAMPDRDIYGLIFIHHINPITIDDLDLHNPDILDMDNLICCSKETHDAIHFGTIDKLMPSSFAERYPGDTTLWR